MQFKTVKINNNTIMVVPLELYNSTPNAIHRYGNFNAHFEVSDPNNLIDWLEYISKEERMYKAHIYSYAEQVVENIRLMLLSKEYRVKIYTLHTAKRDLL